MKLTAKALLALAASVGYAGTDPAEAKAHLVSKSMKLTATDGREVPATEIEWESAPAVKALTITDDMLATGTKPAATAVTQSQPDDVAVKAASMVEDILKKNGLLDIKRPKLTGSDEITSVKSGNQRMYEDGIKAGTSVFSSFDTAYGFDTMIRAKAAQAMGRHDIATKAGAQHNEWLARKGYTSGGITTGASYLRDDFDPDVIRLVKMYGVARKVCKTWKMSSDKVTRPRVSNAGYTVYYPGEGVAGTESTESIGQVQLTAKEGIVIVKASRSFLDDNAVGAGDDIAREIARSIAKVEDDSLFNGSGGNVAGYIPGVQGIINIFGSTATDDSRSVTGGADWFAHTKADLLELMSKVPQFVGGFPAWHCSYEAGAMLLNAAQSQGGASVAEFVGYGLLPTIFNRPIVYNNSMNTTSASASGTIDLLYGDISQAAYFGDRTGIEIDISDQRYWDESNIGIKGRVRHDITVHDLGSTTTQSPVAALYQS